MLEEPRISRPNLISSIRSHVRRKAAIVRIDGPPGIGVTTLLEEYAQSEDAPMMAYVGGATRFSHDPQVVLASLCEQLASRLGEPTPQLSPDTVLFQFSQLLKRAQTRTRHSGPLIFILDGLHQVTEPETIRALFNSLPIGQSGCSFIIAGNKGSFDCLGRDAQDTVTVPGFTIDEARTFLADANLNLREVQTLCHAAGFNPGSLSSARRLLLDGAPFSEVERHLTDRPSDSFALEWDRLQSKSRTLEYLGLLAYEDGPLGASDLAEVLGVPISDIVEDLRSIRFLHTTANEHVEFASPLMRQFAAERLQANRADAIDKLIAHRLRSPDSLKSLRALPQQFSDRKKYEDLLDYLSPQRLPLCVEAVGSAGVVHKSIHQGLSAARSICKYDAFVRFALNASVLASLHASTSTAGEVRALLALKRHEHAIGVASAATMKDDKLKLLAIVARYLKEEGRPVDTALTEQISDLYSQTEPGLSGDAALELAENLLYIHPALGIELVDKITHSYRDDDRADWIVAGVSVGALGEKRTLDATTIAALNSRIQNPDARIAAMLAGVSQDDHAGARIIKQADDLGRHESIRFLSAWVSSNPHHHQALMVIDHVLSKMSAAVDVPDVRALRMLAEAIHRGDISASPEFIRRFDDLTGTAEKLGPTEEHVRLQLALSQVEWTYNRIDATARLERTILWSADLEDPSTRAACQGYAYAALREIDPGQTLETLHTMADSDLRTAIDNTLGCVAQPDESLRPTLRAISDVDIDFAIETAARFTSDERRETGRLDLLFAVLERAGEGWGSRCHKLLREIVDHRRRHRCVGYILDSAIAAPTENALGESDVVSLLSISEDAASSHRTRILARALQLAITQNFDNEVRDRISSELRERFTRIEPPHTKTAVGFELVALLANCSPSHAEEYFKRAVETRDGATFRTSADAQTYTLVARIASAAFAGLFHKSRDTSSDHADIRAVISGASSRPDRVRLWTDLALRLVQEERRDESLKVLEEHIEPLLADALAEGPMQRNLCLRHAAPILYCLRPHTALDSLGSLDSTDRDMAIWSCARYLFASVLPGDAFHSLPQSTYDFGYETAKQLLQLATFSRIDSTAARLLEVVASTAAETRKLSRDQRASIRTELSRIADTIFPMLGGVPHIGYAVTARAHAAKLASKPDATMWQDLAKEARALPNASDVVYTLAVVATTVPSSLGKLRADLLGEAEERAHQLASTMDRYTRLLDIVHLLVGTETTRAKRVLESARDIHASSRAQWSPRRLVDLAYRVDNAFALELSTQLDTDPARSSGVRSNQSQLRIRQLADKVMTDVMCLPADALDAAEVAWMALGDMNAGRSIPLDREAILELIQKSAALPVRSSFPLLSLALASAARRYSGTSESAKFLRELFSGAVIGARVALELAGRKRSFPMAAGNGDSNTDSILVATGQRASAIDWLREWITANLSGDITICDAYFSLKDLEALKLIVSHCDVQSLRIVTSKESVTKIRFPFEETFSKEWTGKFSRTPLPPTEIVGLGFGPEGKSPVHDRWWLGPRRGIRLGTSFSGLGARDSEISVLTPQQFANAADVIESYLTRQRASNSGTPIQYLAFSI